MHQKDADGVLASLTMRSHSRLLLCTMAFALFERVFSVCPTGWFGFPNCLFKCHCDTDGCLDSGDCYPGSGCEKSYYGSACQYVNDVYNETHPLFDHNRSTCNDGAPKNFVYKLLKKSLITYGLIFIKDGEPWPWGALCCFALPELKSSPIEVFYYSDFLGKIKYGKYFIPKRFWAKSVGIDASKPNLFCDIMLSKGRNMALKAMTKASSTAPGKNFSLAFDGDMSRSYDRCASTNPEEEPWLQIIPFSIIDMFSITIYNREGSSEEKTQLKGFSLFGIRANRTENLIYADNSTTFQDVYTIVYEVPNDPFLEFKLALPKSGTPRALTVCEIEIYGECQQGYYGIRCVSPCSPNCSSDQICYPMTGRCYSCANKKHFGKFCNEVCSDGCAGKGECEQVYGDCNDKCLNSSSYLGKKCLTCALTCKNSACSHETGECTSECTEGFYGIYCRYHCLAGCGGDGSCDKTTGLCRYGCKKGTYGPGCDSCSVNCLDDDCNQETGHCLKGCLPGFFGDYCDKECPETCNASLCSSDTGDCIAGCKQGLSGNRCNIKCSPNCNGSICEQATGNCINGCNQGLYGENCTTACSVNCLDDDCNQETGHCLKGCLPGFFGDYCDKECPETCNASLCSSDTGDCIAGCKQGLSGNRCNIKCSPNCNGSICEQATGNCINGCNQGLYGENCTTACSVNCLDNDCNQKTGHCLKGCLPGFFGDYCDKACSKNCVKTLCDWEGQCMEGCTLTFKGTFCEEKLEEESNSGPNFMLIFMVLVLIGTCLLVAITMRRKKDLSLTPSASQQGEQ